MRTPQDERYLLVGALAAAGMIVVSLWLIMYMTALVAKAIS